MITQFKKITSTVLVLSLFVMGTSGCSYFRKKKDMAPEVNATNTDGVKTETTADGGTEKIEASPMSNSALGSDSGSIDGLKTVFFEYDKSTLTQDEQAKLAGDADWLKKNPNAKLTIEGHTDQRGSNEYNLSLGERRASAVKRMLIDLGIDSKRLTTVSFGEEKPLVQGEDEAAMSKNRRANFVPVH